LEGISCVNNQVGNYAGLGNYKLAIDDCSRAIEIKPDYTHAFYNRALVNLKQGDKIFGCRDAQKACALGNCKFLEDAKQRGVCR